MTLLGEIALWVALLTSAWAAFVGYTGGLQGRHDLAQSAVRAVYVSCGALIAASAGLMTALLRHDFNVEYVASYTSRNLPLFYTISGFWAGQKGSLLFWAVVLSIFSALALLLSPRRYRPLLPHVAATCGVVIAFFVAVMIFAGNPFDRLPFTPIDGNGMNPQLQNVGMTIHPPMLYLGFTSITIPFAFGMAALLSKRLDTGWLHAIRKWSLASWLFLAIGIVLGMWWSYVELGWGGYWAWDPVENASFLPWLFMTAFLHSVMIQEKRGMLKKWNLTLVIGAFLLSIFGTFITRSGMIASVHSFAQSSVGYFFLFFLLASGVASFTVFFIRAPLLKAEATLESMVSREASFLFNNLLFVGMAFAVFWGTLFPILSEAMRGVRVTVGPPFFNQVNFPIGLGLLLLTGVGPLIAWRKASTKNLQRQFAVPVFVAAAVAALLLALGVRHGYALMTLFLSAFVLATISQEFYKGVRARVRQYGENAVVALGRLMSRNRRRYGGYIVHLGIVTMFVGFAGGAFQEEIQATLGVGESVELRSPFGNVYTFTHTDVSTYQTLNRQVAAAAVAVDQNGERMGVITSERRQYLDSFGRPTFQPSTEVGLHSGILEDLYIIFAGTIQGTDEVVYQIQVNPLVWWIWFGGFVLTFGGVIVMWPGGTSPVPGKSRATEAGYSVPIEAGVS